MVGIYESHLWNDRQEAYKHKFEPIDVDADWVDRIVDAEAVMIDIESLNQPKRPHTPELFDWFSDIVQQVRDFTDAPVYWYGSVYEPRSRYEWSFSKAFGYVEAWQNSSLAKVIDGIAVPNYQRWNNREHYRFAVKRFACDLAEIPSIAIYWTAYHDANTVKTRRKMPIPHTNIKRQLQELQELYDGVALWSPPTSYEPEEYRRQLHNSRLYALEVME